MSSDTNSTDSIAALAIKAAGSIVNTTFPDGREMLIHPPGFIVKDVSLPQNVKPPIPTYIRQSVEVQTKDALIAYVDRFKTPDTVIFANIDDDQVVAVIDYHSDSATGASKAAITSHRAVLDLGKSTPWSLWNSVDGCMMRQADFAKFVEENSEDIVSPTGAQLLEMVLDLEKSKNIRVVRKMRSAGSDAGEGGNTMEVNGTELPNVFNLRFPVYFGELAVGIKAFTRDALSGDKIITIGFKLARLEMIRQAEFLRISQEIAEATSVPMIAGSIAGVS